MPKNIPSFLFLFLSLLGELYTNPKSHFLQPTTTFLTLLNGPLKEPYHTSKRECISAPPTIPRQENSEISRDFWGPRMLRSITQNIRVVLSTWWTSVLFWFYPPLYLSLVYYIMYSISIILYGDWSTFYHK